VAAWSGRAARIDCSPSGWGLGEQTASLLEAERSGGNQRARWDALLWRASAPTSCQLRRRPPQAVAIEVPEDGSPVLPALFMVAPSTRAGVKAPSTLLHGPDFASGSPPMTPTRGSSAGIERAGSSSVRLVDQPLHDARAAARREDRQPTIPHRRPRRQRSRDDA